MTSGETTGGGFGARLRRAAGQAAAIAVAAAALASISAMVHPRRPDWFPERAWCPEVAWSLAQEWRGTLVLVDARKAKDYEREHIPEALWLNEAEWDRGFAAVVRRWRPGDRIVVYCDKDSCDSSQAVAQRLRREMGIEQVYVLKGGWTAWTAARTGAR